MLYPFCAATRRHKSSPPSVGWVIHRYQRAHLHLALHLRVLVHHKLHRLLVTAFRLHREQECPCVSNIRHFPAHRFRRLRRGLVAPAPPPLSCIPNSIPGAPPTTTGPTTLSPVLVHHRTVLLLIWPVDSLKHYRCHCLPCFSRFPLLRSPRFIYSFQPNARARTTPPAKRTFSTLTLSFLLFQNPASAR